MAVDTTRGIGAGRKALALLAASALVGSLIVVFSPPAWGDPPSVECSSDDPEWDDDYWKVHIVDGMLSTVDTNVAGAISLDANGSWTNDDDDDSVFRIVLKVGAGTGVDQVVAGMWAPGDGGTIDMTLNALGHITFCFTDDDDDDDEPAPTTTTTTTASPTTTTTSASPTTTTTSGGLTTTTSPDVVTTTTPGTSTTTPASDATTTNAANPTEVSDSALSSDASQPNESAEAADGSQVDGSLGPDGTLPDDDRDTTVAGLIGGWGEPPALGQESVSSNATPGVIPGSHDWPTQLDLAILGALIAAIAILIERRRLRRLVGKSR